MKILMVSDVYFPRINGVSTSIRTFHIAGKHPELISDDVFHSEFIDSPTHKHILEEIRICLNKDNNPGIYDLISFISFELFNL